MPPACIPKNDDQRLASLARYNILDTDVEEVFDRITLMARSLFDTKIALVSLVDRDRQWFKSHIGLDVRETPRDQAFCGHAILQSEPLIVEDASKDQRFSDNPLVTSKPFIRFYAGAQLVSKDGHKLGTLCVIDDKPRQLKEDDKRLLNELAKLAMNEIELKILQRHDKKREKYQNRDEFSNAYNQKTFKRLLEAECSRTRAHRSKLSLAVINFDYLGSVEGSRSESAVNQVAKSFCSCCKSVTRRHDLIARLGATKFALLMPKTSSESAEIVVRRILSRANVFRPQIDGEEISYNLSVGIAQLSDRQSTAAFFKEADQNCLVAAQNGKNEYVASYAA